MLLFMVIYIMHTILKEAKLPSSIVKILHFFFFSGSPISKVM